MKQSDAMASRSDLQDWVVDALREHGGKASIVDVARSLWARHEQDLRHSGDLFYTWQYDMRWACTQLRTRKLVQPAEASEPGIWHL